MFCAQRRRLFWGPLVAFWFGPCFRGLSVGLDLVAEDTDDDSFVLDEDEDVDGDGYWWWQSTEAKAARWVVPQWEVLAADRGGWRAGLKGLRVNESEVDVC